MRNERLEQALAELVSGAVPVPEEKDIFVGGGSYLQIGAEFLRYFVENANLDPDDTVLDVGSGIGRIASGLSLYLDAANGRYIGFDPVIEGVEWCRKAFADKPNFQFEWVDLFNELYRPDGKVLATEFAFPVESATVDLAIVTSVFTHLYELEIAAYLRQLARVVKPGGKVFATAFLYNGEAPLRSGAPHLRFDTADAENPQRWHVSGYPPLAAVCYSERYFTDMVEKAFGRQPQIHGGRWRGATGPWFQDLVLI